MIPFSYAEGWKMPSLKIKATNNAIEKVAISKEIPYIVMKKHF
jgi:hypothetical protein